MQIHEITLREAEWKPLDPKDILAKAQPTKFDFSPTPSSNDSNAIAQMAQQLQQPGTPAGPSQSSTQGTITPTASGLTHTASSSNPNKTVAPATTVNPTYNNQLATGNATYKVNNPQVKTATTPTAPAITPSPTVTATTPVAPTTNAATTAPATVTTTPPAAPTMKSATATSGDRLPPPGYTNPPAPQSTTAAATTKATTPVIPNTPLNKTYPPITLGTGPKAQVFVNKGSGYVDSKTNKPMPPAIVKAMGL